MTLRFSGLLLRLVGYQRTFEVTAATLGAALDAAEALHPQLRPVLRDADGRLRRTHRIFINGELAVKAGLDTALGDGDDVEFLTAIAGG